MYVELDYAITRGDRMRDYGNMIGKRFGRLTVISQAESRKGRRYWNCVCDCGNTKVVDTRHLNDGGTSSCGCFRSEMARKNQTKHGMLNTPIYRAWNSMKNRCKEDNQNRPHYYDKGISVCKEWEESFEKFYEDMGKTYFEKAFLDRIDNTKGYSKENCRWVNVAISNLNKKNVTKIIYNDDLISLKEYCTIKGIPYGKYLKKVKELGLVGKTIKPDEVS